MHDFGKIVYLEMQKSGSTYVNTFLKKCCLLKESKHRKHDVIRDDYDSRKFYFVTIRHPLDLYASLYRYGVDGRGGVYKRLEKEQKTECYSSLESFVEFITDPSNAMYLGGGYSEKIANKIGFMSFRFMKISLQFPLKKMTATLENKGDLLDLENKFITDLEIKNEHLNDELRRLSTELFPDLFNQDKVKIFLDSSKKINATTRLNEGEIRKEIEKLAEKIATKEALLFSRYSKL